MKLDRLPEYVVPAVVTMCGMGLAIVMGYFMGQGRISYVVLMVTALLMGTLTLALRQYVWLLIPFGWPLTGNIPLLPLPFAVRDIVVSAAFVSFLMLIALKVVRRKPRYEMVDYLLFALLIYLVTVFIRNPVGTEVTGAMRIGGRPYFNVAIACMAYWVLSRSVTSAGAANFPIWGTLASNYMAGGLSVIAELFPKTLPVLANFYSGVSGADTFNAPPGTAQAQRDPEESRLIYLGIFGLPTIQALLAFFRPLTLINPLYFGRFFCLVAASLLQLMSGFRSNIIAALNLTLLAAWMRGGIQGVLRVLVVGGFALGLLLLGQGRIFNLPFAAQRALCFLPGQWNPMAVADAKNSTEWRLVMWKEYLRTNKYVENHLLGDGFGFSKRDLDMIASLAVIGGGDDQESMMVVGNIHNGPLSAIRAVGYVGLGVYLFLLSIMARMAWGLMQRARGTGLFPLALFVGLPAVYQPFSFVVIFGAFENDLPYTIFYIGMLKVLNRSLEELPASAPERVVEDLVWSRARHREEVLTA